MTGLIRIGTRGSALARWQSDFIAARIGAVAPQLRVEIVEITSAGDRIADEPLWFVEGTGFFTASIERALIDGDVDVAVHSFKDLPVVPTPGLTVAAIPERAPVEDVLCAADRRTLDTLPAGARVGTCSARRMGQIRALRPDLDLRPLRGNVPTRIDRVINGELDAVVLARAGVMRLGLGRHITEIFAIDRVLPAPAQGALAVQCRTGDRALGQLLSVLDHAATRAAVTAERVLLHALRGGCSVPVGAVATADEGELAISAGVFSMDGAQSIRTSARGSDPILLGEAAAHRLLALGAGSILEQFERTARLESAVHAAGAL